MLWVKSFHIIFMVAWFAGLFYLPRLFVYHASANDTISIERFKLMEKKLYYIIMMPAALLTILFGLWLVSFNVEGYLHSPWFHAKMGLVFLLIVYHLYLGKLRRAFQMNRNPHKGLFYRFINEIPGIFLILIVILAVVKPSLGG